jgi:hypothetical protein
MTYFSPLYFNTFSLSDMEIKTTATFDCHCTPRHFASRATRNMSAKWHSTFCGSLTSVPRQQTRLFYLEDQGSRLPGNATTFPIRCPSSKYNVTEIITAPSLSFLGALANSEKVNMSVRLHGTTRIPLDVVSLNFILEFFLICQ